MARPYLRLALVVSFLIFSTANVCHADEGLAKKIEEITNGPGYKQGRWAILVVDAKTGETLYAHNPDRLATPASTTKLYSCAAALIALGQDYKFDTPIYRRGELTDDRLRGDLILVASGDLTLGGRTLPDGRMAYTNHDHIYASSGTEGELTATDPLAGIKSLAKQVAAKIKTVTGDVLIDDRLFEKNRGSGSGPDTLTPILVNDNIVDVIVTPAEKPGQPAIVKMRPETNYIQMDAQVMTADAGRRTQVVVESVGPQRFAVRGQIAVKAKPLVRIYAVDDPAGFARALLIDALRQEGVAVGGSPLATPRAELPEKDSYAKMTCVAGYTSPPLSEAIKVTLKVSHNLYASTLPLLIAAKNGKRTLADGLRLQGRHLSELGVDVKTISFGGGAGGALADSITPRATIQLLQAMAKRPDYAAYHDGFPILGVDGTLADVVPADSPAKGKVSAKTGTLYWHDLMNDRSLLRSKALAGTMTTASGRELLVAMFVNDVPQPRGAQPSREGKVLGKLCEIVYQNVR